MCVGPGAWCLARLPRLSAPVSPPAALVPRCRCLGRASALTPAASSVHDGGGGGAATVDLVPRSTRWATTRSWIRRPQQALSAPERTPSPISWGESHRARYLRPKARLPAPLASPLPPRGSECQRSFSECGPIRSADAWYSGSGSLVGNRRGVPRQRPWSRSSARMAGRITHAIKLNLLCHRGSVQP